MATQMQQKTMQCERSLLFRSGSFTLVWFCGETVSRGTVRKVRFENKASVIAMASNNRLSEFLRTFLIKADLYQIGVYPVRYSETRHAEVAKRTFIKAPPVKKCLRFAREFRGHF
jgi:hypothetical protein